MRSSRMRERRKQTRATSTSSSTKKKRAVRDVTPLLTGAHRSKFFIVCCRKTEVESEERRGPHQRLDAEKQRPIRQEKPVQSGQAQDACIGTGKQGVRPPRAQTARTCRSVAVRERSEEDQDHEDEEEGSRASIDFLVKFLCSVRYFLVLGFKSGSTAVVWEDDRRKPEERSVRLATSTS